MPLVADLDRAKPVLSSINWSFSTPFSVGRSGVRLFDCRKHHWYPATFIPEIPYTLIEILTLPGAVVYDPFGGIGTTLFQALVLGRKPCSTEVCQVAVDFARCTWRLLSPATDLPRVTEYWRDLKTDYDTEQDYAQRQADAMEWVEQLRPWFGKETFNQIMYLVARQAACSDPGVKSAAEICLSATLKAVCAQDRGWGCISDNMLPKAEQIAKHRDALERFGRHLSILTKDLAAVKQALSPATLDMIASLPAESCIYQGDTRQSPIPDQSVDMVVTSPPYPNMTDYALSQRLSYYLLRAEPDRDVPVEIGARRRRSGTASVGRYCEDMKVALQSICRKIVPGGYACFVMPSFDVEKQNDIVRKQAVQECMGFLLTQGMVMELELNRILPTRRRHHNQKWTNLEREQISIYRKVK